MNQPNAQHAELEHTRRSDYEIIKAYTIGMLLSLVLWAALFLAVWLILAPKTAHAGELGTTNGVYTDAQIVSAIYRVEGGDKTKYPYGIRSVKCESKEECRQVCLRTVKNNRVRYQRAKAQGFSGDFLNFLALRYCPIKSDPQGHKNWIKNIREILKKGI